MHPFRHTSSWSTKNCSSQTWIPKSTPKLMKKLIQELLKMGTKIGFKSASEEMSILGTSWDHLGTFFGTFFDKKVY